MRECGAACNAILAWVACAAGIGIKLLVDEVGGQLPTLQSACLGFNTGVVLTLPLVFVPKVAAVQESVNAKRARVTSLHELISSNCAPCVIDRGTGTLAQGRFRQSSGSDTRP
jgi:hypothetical protein|eukprot:COSAG01_NODE_8410_length_2794_cov_5.715399_2_plen_113_part_00